MSAVLVKVDNVSKKFCRSLKKSLWYGMQDLGSEIIGKSRGGKGELRPDEFWAVSDVSFELKRGECLGLIGANGAGKSTLLKMLNGLIKPDKGRIEMNGRVGALIELGAGFNPVLSGSENIYVNGSVLGFTKKEIDRKFDDIVKFAEIGEFLDMPVQNYSSGMKVRLGFAVAAQMEPDVLIIDEVLAVGDIGFTLKCLNWIDSSMRNTCVIFVSHSMPMVSRICSDIILMDRGTVQYQGKEVGTGIFKYHEKFISGESLVTFNPGNKTELIDASLVGAGREDRVVINRLDDLSIKFIFDVDIDIENPVITLFFLDKEQRPLAECQNVSINESSKVEIKGVKKRYEVYLRLKRVQFSAGEYNVTFGLSEGRGEKPLLRVRNAIAFYINSDRYVWPPFELEGEWSKEAQV